MCENHETQDKIKKNRIHNKKRDQYYSRSIAFRGTRGKREVEFLPDQKQNFEKIGDFRHEIHKKKSKKTIELCIFLFR